MVAVVTREVQVRTRPAKGAGEPSARRTVRALLPARWPGLWKRWSCWAAQRRYPHSVATLEAAGQGTVLRITYPASQAP